MRRWTFTIFAILIFTVTSMGTIDMKKKTELATFGGGCFWCVEAIFERVTGVQLVVSGYAGGHVDNPSYKQVTTGTTGHAEVIQISFDPEHPKEGEPTTISTTIENIGSGVGVGDGEIKLNERIPEIIFTNFYIISIITGELYFFN